MFDFGKNWQDFSTRVLDDGHLAQARDSLVGLLGCDSLAGRSFVDVGFGSGIFSIAARQLGADPVVGIDVSAESVEAACTNARRFLENRPAPESRLASILDSGTVESLGQFDVVYAWGVLHHTGRMWDAVRNTAALVKPGGLLALAVYNRHVTSPPWKAIKWCYNHVPRLLQRIMVLGFMPAIFLAKFLVTRKSPLRKRRGMDFRTDVVDWLGGYPYEYARADDVVSFVTALGFRLSRMTRPATPIGCNEFVFVRTADEDDSQAPRAGRAGES